MCVCVVVLCAMLLCAFSYGGVYVDVCECVYMCVWVSEWVSVLCAMLLYTCNSGGLYVDLCEWVCCVLCCCVRVAAVVCM